MFKSKKITYVASQAVPLLEEIPNTLSGSVFTSVYQKRDLPLGLVDDLVNGINLNMRRVKTIGKKKFPNGLPQSELIGLGANYSELATVIGNQIGKPVTVYESTVDPIDVATNVQIYLYNELEFNPFTEEFNSFDALLDSTKQAVIAAPWNYVTVGYLESITNPSHPYTLRSIRILHVGNVTEDSFIDEGVTFLGVEDLTTYTQRFNRQTEVVEKLVGQFHFKINYEAYLKFLVNVVYWVNLNRDTYDTTSNYDQYGSGSTTQVWFSGFGDTTETWDILSGTTRTDYSTRVDSTHVEVTHETDEETGEIISTTIGATTTSWTYSREVVVENTYINKNPTTQEVTSAYTKTDTTNWSSNSEGLNAQSNFIIEVTTELVTSGGSISTIRTTRINNGNNVVETLTGNQIHATTVNGKGFTYRVNSNIEYELNLDDSVEFKELDLVDPRKHYIANYSYEDGGVTQYRIWTHPFDQPLPGINVNTNNFVDDEFYPIVPVRLNNQFLSQYGSPDEIKYSKQILNNYGINLEELEDNLGENQDIADIDRAYIWSGVDISTQSREGKLYVYHFFDKLVEKAVSNKSTFENWYQVYDDFRRNTGGDSGYDVFWVARTIQSIPKQVVSIKDNLFNVEIEFLYAEKSIINGEYEAGVKPKSVKIQTIPSGYIQATGGVFGVVTSFDFTEELEILYQMPLGIDGIPKYTRIIIGGLGHRNTIKNGRAVLTPVAALNDPDDNNFILPMVEVLARNMNIVERDRLYYESLVLIVNSYEIQKVKWYQTAFFRMVLIFVGIVLAQPQLTALGTSIAAATSAIAVLKIIVPIIFRSIIIKQIMKLAVKVLGEDLALIVAVVATIMSLGSSKNLLSFDLPFADELLMLGTSLMSAVNDSITADLERIMNDISRFSSEAAEKMDELDKIQKELNAALKVDPFNFVGLKSFIINGENSDEYFERILSATDSPRISIEAVSKFVDIMLQLPELKDLEEEIEI